MFASMNRKKLVRVELILLALVTLLLAYRISQGPPEPEGVVVLSDIEPERLRHAAFSLDRPARIAIEAVGSYESTDGNASLAAYGWVLDRKDREVVWRMEPETSTRDRGSVATARDTVELDPGIYDIYFSSFGNRNSSRFGISLLDRIFGNESGWRNDDSEWRMVVRMSDGERTAVERLEEEPDDQLAPQPPNAVWSTAPMRGRQNEEYVFRVADSARLFVYAVGEIGDEQMDYGMIENVLAGERLWEMTIANTDHAGGWNVNRVYSDTLSIEPGIYRAVYETDALQSWGDWVGNPPFDVAGWGITLSADPVSAVTAFDPVTTRSPIIELTRVGNDERRRAQFRVNEPVHVVANAVGEIGEGSRYDWAWLRNNESQESVWEMTWENSRRTGDHDNNRAEMAFFHLEPGAYTLGYETDDSHAFDSWRHALPEHPNRWGVSLFPVEEDVDSTIVEVLGYEQSTLENDDMRPPPPPAPSATPDLPGTTILTFSEVGNETRRSESIVLDEQSNLHVQAMGEISISGRYDYAWIENTETGEIVWEMTWQNTRPAGGADRNRRFDGTVTLDAGTYTVHYRSDFSHAYGDFGDEAPIDPQNWGIRISKL